jgi:NAD(P)H dehydrogenase (quinone)
MPMTRQTRITVVYYSATGNVHGLAHALAEGAEAEGAEVRLRHVEELFSELQISQNQHWGRHRAEVEAQLKQFLDQAGRLWQEGKLADRVGTAFTASMTPHGGQESTILALNNTLYHWGMVILPLGYTVREVFAAGGNPYGTSWTSGKSVTGPDAKALAVARYQGQRLARYAAVIAAAREEDGFSVRRPRPERFDAAALG